ncbi:MAG: hypothetical protein HRT87_04775 [Legionellales bacterium]|nr:hypothetical protein [Legionellales bacterium]
MKIIKNLLFVFLITIVHCSLSMKVVVTNETKKKIASYTLMVYEFEDNFRFNVTDQDFLAGASSTYNIGISSRLIYYFGLIIHFKDQDQDNYSSNKVVIQLKSYRKLFDDDTVNISISDEETIDVNLEIVASSVNQLTLKDHILPPLMNLTLI